jgi:phytoene dehydrogenase-like protein
MVTISIFRAQALYFQIYVESQAGYMYSDNGWQNLIDGLVKVAKNVGVRIILGEKVTKLKKTDSPGW